VYNEKEFTSADIADFVGFVYLLTDRESGRRYIGKKCFFSTRTLVLLKGKTKRRKKSQESDWQTYCSSNIVIQRLVAEHGLDRFKREILHLCRTKSEVTYHETRMQIENEVLLSDNWFNSTFSVA
jgi:hypothetical protein